MKMNEMDNASQPFYMYKDPMFMVTVSVVVIVENGVVVVRGGEVGGLNDGIVSAGFPVYRFPGGKVKAGQETIQFSAVRQVKEQTGITLKKEDLMPVDFRSDPERSDSKNIIDMGMVCMPDLSPDFEFKKGAKLVTVDFEKKMLNEDFQCFYMDHDVLLERAIDVALLMR